MATTRFEPTAPTGGVRPRSRSTQGSHPLVKFATHPVVRMFIGLAASAAAVCEIARDFNELSDLWRKLGSEHGILMIGTIQFLHSVGELLEYGGESLEVGEEFSLGSEEA